MQIRDILWFSVLIAIAVVIMFVGCSPLASSIKEAEKNDGNLCASYIGPWGTVQLSKSNQGAGTLRCRPDGHSFRDPE